MRLINTKTLEFEEFVSPPPYAILSHTWGSEETSYQDFQHPKTRDRQHGFLKIMLTCRLAQADGLQLAWVDTCCIDKTSSAELSEAINSMFKWYQRAAVCYAYLPDVQDNEDHLDPRSKFARSRWFTRGWTLQELIAPAKMCFFGARWAKLGDKIELESAIHKVTGIDKDVLRGGSLNDISVARRMSWASKRQTTREEDIAYCLMGIFDINMPMLYGEGKKAFIRLQEEILKETGDESLFAWSASMYSAPFRGIFADSPAEFEFSADIIPFRDLAAFKEPMITSRGVSLTRGYESQGTILDRGQIWIRLGCRLTNQNLTAIAIELTPKRGNHQYYRSSPSKLFHITPLAAEITTYVLKSGHHHEVREDPDLQRQYSFYFRIHEGLQIVRMLDGAQWNPSDMNMVSWSALDVNRQAGMLLKVSVVGKYVILIITEHQTPTGGTTCKFGAKYINSEDLAESTYQRMKYPHTPDFRDNPLKVRLTGLHNLILTTEYRKVLGTMLCVVDLWIHEHIDRVDSIPAHVIQ